jgi:serine protease Do
MVNRNGDMDIKSNNVMGKPTTVKRVLLACMVVLTLAIPDRPLVFAGSADIGPPSFSELANEVKHCVVNISTTQVVQGRSLQPFSPPDSTFRDFFGDDFFKRFFGDMPHGQWKTHALGSGFVISQDGFILTNNHVIEKATEIKIRLHSGKEYDARIVGADLQTDLALIKAKPDSDFPGPARMGDSGAVQVGDWVMAVGNPFGLGHTVRVGIISAKGCIIGAGPYDDFLQTDAAINPGNSGGPLFNMKGEVVGINTAIVAQGENIGFATPIKMVKELLPETYTDSRSMAGVGHFKEGCLSRSRQT